MRARVTLSIFAALLAVLATTSSADVPGVTDDRIRIGSCSALEGPASFLGTQTVVGAEAYLAHVNAQGGVHGRTIELVSKDDGYEPKRTIACVNELLKQDEVFALGFFVGTPTGAKAAPMAEAKKVPLVGLFTGAELLRTPVKRYVLNVRASYFDETRVMVDNLVAVGKKKVAVFYQEDAFGHAVLTGVKKALAAHGLEPVALGTYARNTMAIEAGLEAIRPADPDAVVMVGTYAPLARFVRDGRAAGLDALYLNVSFVGTEAFAKEAGEHGEGVIITQVVPPPNRTDLSAVKLYHDCLTQFAPDAEPNFVSLEGFVNAMVLVEALERAGRDLTRDGLVAAIESIQDHDLGIGMPATYAADDHQAFGSVFTTVLRDGEAVVFEDWSTVVQ